MLDEETQAGTPPAEPTPTEQPDPVARLEGDAGEAPTEVTETQPEPTEDERLTELHGFVESERTRTREEAVRERDEAWRSELQPQQQAIAESTQKAEGTARRWLQSWDDRMEAARDRGDDDVVSRESLRAMERFMDDNQDGFNAFKVLAGKRSRELEDVGYRDGAVQVAGFLLDKADQGESGKLLNRLAERLAGKPDPTLAGDFAKLLSAPLIEKAREEGAEMARKNMRDEQLKERRNGDEAPAKVTVAGGGVPNEAQDRLDRLSLGKDRHGNAATQEDKAWLSARN